MKTLEIRLETTAPIVVARPDADANSLVSYKWLPGSAVRGAVLSQWRTCGRGPNAFDERFVDGTAAFLPGYPALVGDGLWQRSLPVPLAWHVPKHNAEDLSPIVDLLRDDRPEARLVPLDGFFVPSASMGSLLDVRQRISIHTQRNAEFGRPMPPDKVKDGPPGAVFRMIAIDEGQAFVACVRSADDAFLSDLVNALQPGTDLFFGRSRGAMGSARIHATCLHDEWVEYSTSEDALEGGGVLTFVTPALLRDAFGEWTSDLPEEELGRMLGVTNLKVLDRVGTRDLVGGFTRKANLPQSHALAVSAGSTYLLTWDGVPKGLHAAVDAGVGERRPEGFGRFCFNVPTPAALTRVGPAIREQRRGATSAREQSMVELLARRLYEQRAQDVVRQFGSSVTLESGTPPALLARVRRLVRVTKTDEGTGSHLGLAGPAMNKLRNAKVAYKGHSGEALVEAVIKNKDVEPALLAAARDSQVGEFVPQPSAADRARAVDLMLGTLTRQAQRKS